MKSHLITHLSLAAATLIFLLLWLNEHTSARSAADAMTEGRYKQVIVKLLERDGANRLAIEQLNQQILQSDVTLTEVSNALRNSHARIRQFQQVEDRGLSEDAAKKLAGINGATNRFAKLISPEGLVFGEQMELSSTLGRWLIFKDPDGKRFKHDVEELHPVILTALGLDASSMKESHEKLMEQKTKSRVAVAEAISRASAETAKMMKDEAERKRQLAVESARIEEERAKREAEIKLAQAALAEQKRQAMASEALRRQELEASLIQAAASAEIARLDALRRSRRILPPTTNQTGTATP